jgi:hypothetical protein
MSEEVYWRRGEGVGAEGKESTRHVYMCTSGECIGHEQYKGVRT